MSASATYQVVWPRSERTVAFKNMAPRHASLAGKKVALLWDNVFRGDEIWEILKPELSARYPGISFVDHDVFGNTHGHDEHEVVAAIPGKLRELGVDAVVSGVGC